MENLFTWHKEVNMVYGQMKSMAEEGFKEGDVVYLDVSHFKDWENEDAQIYINFTNVSKTENGDKDITISTADKNLYQPKIVNIKADTNVYAYKVAEEDERKMVLRFWRGDKEKLWNCSIPLSYSEFVEGNDSIRILGWNDTGEKYQGEYPIDEDQDGVEYTIEKLFGTSDVKSDTDGDGLTDYIEIYQSETDPCIKDTNENGVEDGGEDSDEDGLTNLEEVQYGTDLGKSDTDGDGLKDGEEKNKYYTNPVKYDTDDDGISDGNEVLLGLNPLKIKSDGVTLDAERTFEQKLDEGCIEEELLEEENLVKPYISGNVPDVIDEHVAIGLEELDILEDNRAVIGNQINLETDYAQDTKLELHFECNSDRKDYFMICRYENDEIIPCETNIEEDDIWTTAESGCYFVMDAEQLLMDLDIPITDYKEETKKTTFNTILKNSSTEKSTKEKSTNNQVDEDWYEKNYTLIDEDGNKIEESSKSISNYSTKNEGIHYILSSVAEQTGKEIANISNKISGQADVVFVIDSTGSMSGTINNVVSNIDEFVDALTSNYAVKANFALIDYKDITRANEETVLVKNGTSNWFTDAAEFKNCINSIYVSGGGDVPETALNGLAMASQLDFRKNANKFIVLVTDADYKNENNYEISSMEEMVSILSNSNIVTSVITSDTYESTYHNLYTDTNGVFGNINGNFSEELLKLAEKIGDVVNDGSWVLLNDFQYVKINSTDITDGTDTDGDGLTDAEELGEEVEIDMTPYIKEVLKRYDKPYECYQGKTFVKTYKYKSSPVELDTDYDGIPDRKDDNPKSNMFEGKMHYDVGKKDVKEKTCNVEFSVNYRNLFKENKKYKKQLAVLSSLFASDVYRDIYIEVTKGTTGGNYSQLAFAKLFGLEHVADIEVKGDKYDPDDVTEFVVGHRGVYYNNEYREIIVLAIRGTNGKNAEWSSNFDVGADDDAYYSKVGTNHPDWKNKINHKGFDVTANRVLKEYEAYVKEHELDKSNCKKSILITGHSRGGAIANLLGAHFEKDKEYQSYTYTFAGPYTTTDSNASNKKYNSINNIVNEDDLIPYLPLEKWGFTRYGVTRSISVEKEYEHKGLKKFAKKGTWEWLMKKDYNNDGGTQRTIEKFKKIAKNRKQLYVYDVSKDGKVNVENIVYPDILSLKEGKNSLMKKLREVKLRRFCKFKTLKKQKHYYIETTYCPAYLMQNLANMASGVGPTTGYRVSGKYNEAKLSFILSSGQAWEDCPVGGMAHPHMQPTYYLIAYNNFNKL